MAHLQRVPDLSTARTMEQAKRNEGYNARLFLVKTGYAVVWSTRFINV